MQSILPALVITGAGAFLGFGSMPFLFVVRAGDVALAFDFGFNLFTNSWKNYYYENSNTDTFWYLTYLMLFNLGNSHVLY